MGLFSNEIAFARRQIERDRAVSDARFEPRNDRFQAQIVRFDGNLDVPNKPNYNYAREFSPTDTDPPFQVFNDKVQAREGLRVWIGSGLGGRLEVLDWDSSALVDLPEYDGENYQPINKADFEWPDFAPGPNALNVYPRSHTELRCYPGEAGGLTISVAPFRYYKNGAVTLFTGVLSQSISSSSPSGPDEARFVGVYLDLADTTIKTVDGTVTIDSPSQTPDSPTFPTDNIIPICLIRLDDEQTSVNEADFVDARQFINNPNVTTLYSPDGTETALSADNNGDITVNSPTAGQGISYAHWHMGKLVDSTEGQLFNQNTASTPTGWTETDAADQSTTAEKYGFWFLAGTSAETSYDYRKQSGVTIESLASNFYAAFQFGPLLFRDAAYTADVDYTFGVHRDNSGIDLDTFVRGNLHWDSSMTQWQVRGESKDGTTQTNGTYQTFSFPLQMPIYLRVVVRNHTTAGSRKVRVYVGTSPEPQTHTLLQDNTFSATWGAVYWRIEQSRGAGNGDNIFLGAVDYLADQR